jgi:hypothetical protein
MAKKRNGSTNDPNRMTAKQRQQAASRAAGLVAVDYSRYDNRGRKLPAYSLSMTVAQTAANRRLVLREGRAKAKYQKVWAGEKYRDWQSGMPITKVYGSEDRMKNPQGYLDPPEKATEKFLASEKRKSGKTTARNVKRRER